MYCFKIGGHSFHSQCVKLVRIRIYSGPPFPEFGLNSHFPAFGQNTEILRLSPYSVQMPENASQNNSKFGRFLRSEYLKRSFFIEKFKTKNLLLYKIYYLTAICKS